MTKSGGWFIKPWWLANWLRLLIKPSGTIIFPVILPE